MQIGVFGVSHTLTQLKDRETWIKWIRYFFSSTTPLQTPHHVLLMTCNRCEIYFSGPHIDLFSRFLQKEFFKSTGKTDTYTFYDQDCFSHLAKVASGLLSADLGESDIRRQIKEAYEKYARTQKLPSALHYLFQKSLKIGKQISTLISKKSNPLSLESLILDLIFKIPNPRKIFFLGNSQINRQLIGAFKEKTKAMLLFCSQHHDDDYPFKNVTLINFSQLEVWKECDIVICATDQNHILLTEQTTPPATKLCIDLSVPRCVHSSLKKQMTLLDMEDLNSLLAHSPPFDQKHLAELFTKVDLAVSETMHRYQLKKEKKQIYQIAFPTYLFPFPTHPNLRKTTPTNA